MTAGGAFGAEAPAFAFGPVVAFGGVVGEVGDGHISASGSVVVTVVVVLAGPPQKSVFWELP
eukprot:10664609-Lingulodinium_polyedra.AAC.1